MSMRRPNAVARVAACGLQTDRANFDRDWGIGHADGIAGARWAPPAGHDELAYALGYHAGSSARRVTEISTSRRSM